jgi:serine protease Do
MNYVSGRFLMMKNRRYGIWVLCFISILLLMARLPVYAQHEPANIPTQETDEIRLIKAIDRARISVVRIETDKTDGTKGVGSGIIIKENGFILTNDHVLKNARHVVVVIFNGKKFNAVVNGRSPRNDLAILKINASGLTVPKWGDSRKLNIGQTAIAIGNPYRFEGSVSHGIISALDRRIPASGIIYKDLIQTDAAINPGSSGGALIDSRGMIIGINTLLYTGRSGQSAQGIGFAIPIHRALLVAKQLMSEKILVDPRPWIGLQGIDVTRSMAEMNMLPVNSGVLITDIHPVSPAERSDLRKGDIVIMADDRNVLNTQQFKDALDVKKPGDDMVLRIWREGKLITVTLKVSQRTVAP